MFSIFRCTKCFKLDPSTDHKLCPACGSNQHIKYWINEGASHQEAVAIFLGGLRKNVELYQKILKENS